MVNLTWEIADGVIFYLRPLEEMKKTISKNAIKKQIDVTCQIITCISENAEEAILRAKKHLHFMFQLEISIENFYQKMGSKMNKEYF